MGSDQLDVASYVPSRVIRYFEGLVETGQAPPAKEHMTPISCILLVADISGFTALSKCVRACNV